MAPGLTNGTYGPTEIVAAGDVAERMGDLLARPDVDHVKVWRIDGQPTPAEKRAKEKRRAAAKRSRHAKSAR